MGSLNNGFSEQVAGYKARIEKIITMPMSHVECMLRSTNILFGDVEGREFIVLTSIFLSTQYPKTTCIEKDCFYFPKGTLVSYLVDKR